MPTSPSPPARRCPRRDGQESGREQQHANSGEQYSSAEVRFGLTGLREDRGVAVLRRELREPLAGDQPADRRPTDERREAGPTDHDHVQQRPPDPWRGPGPRVGRGTHQESGRRNAGDGVIPGEVGQTHRDATRGDQMMDVVVGHPQDEPADRPRHEEDERRLAHPVGAVKHDHRVKREQRGYRERIAPRQSPVSAHADDLNHCAGHEQRRHDRFRKTRAPPYRAITGSRRRPGSASSTPTG